MKVAKFSFLNEKSYNKTVIDFTFGRHKDLSTRKSDSGLGELSLFRVDKSLCLPNVKSITVLLYDFSFKNENFATFTFVVKDMFNLLSKTSKDFLTSFSNFYYNIIRTSDSLNEGLPIKMTREKFQRK